MKQRNTEALTRYFIAVEYSFLILQWALLVGSIYSFYYLEYFFGTAFFVCCWLSFKFRKRMKAIELIDKRLNDIKVFYAKIGRSGRRKLQRENESRKK